MKRLFTVFLVLIVIAGKSFSQDSISVSLPTLNVGPDDVFIVSVDVSALTGLNVTSFQMSMAFSDTVLRAQGASVEGTLLQAWGQPTVTVGQSGVISLGSFDISALEGAGTLVNILFEVVGEPGDSSLLYFDSFVLNQGNPVAKTDTGLVTVESLATVIVSSNYPSETNVMVDGVTESVPFDTLWARGTEHVLGVESPQLYNIGKRCVFSSWSDGGDQIHIIRPVSDTLFFAYFVKEFELIVDTDPPNLVEISGGGWYQENTMVTTGEAPFNAVLGDTSYEFVTWKLDSIEQSGNPLSIQMDMQHKATARYDLKVGVRSEPDSKVPLEFNLQQNYPNPFNSQTTIKYQISLSSHVVIMIYNTLGKEIITLVNKHNEPGYYTVNWDGKDYNGNTVANGIYLYKLQAGYFSEVKKMTQLK